MYKHLKSSVSNERGMALLITIFAAALMIFIAIELAYNTSVESRVSYGQINKLVAYYNAKTGVQISLLKIHVYKQIVSKFGDKLGQNKSMLDLIWQFPFKWPLPDMPGASSFDVDKNKKAQKDAFLKGIIDAVTEGEGGKIDINDLGSGSVQYRNSVKNQLVQILKQRLEAEDDWAKRNRDMRPEEIINNIQDWVDADTESANGGDEKSQYGGGDGPTPPNRSFKTLPELHLVKGVTDDIYDVLAPRVTVLGVKGINVNMASAEVIKSIDKQLTDEHVKDIIARRNDPALGGKFKSAEEFMQFCQGLPGIDPRTFNINPDTKELLVPLLAETEYNFRIKSYGEYKKVSSTINAVVYDFEQVKKQMIKLSTTPSPGPSAPPGGGGTTPTPTATPTPTPGSEGQQPAPGSEPPKGPPHIIFWEEL